MLYPQIRLLRIPLFAAWVTKSLQVMENAAVQANIPIKPHRLTPNIKDTFWVNLIGKGYPAPRHKFRWCTERFEDQPVKHLYYGCGED